MVHFPGVSSRHPSSDVRREQGGVAPNSGMQILTLLFPPANWRVRLPQGLRKRSGRSSGSVRGLEPLSGYVSRRRRTPFEPCRLTRSRARSPRDEAKNSDEGAGWTRFGDLLGAIHPWIVATGRHELPFASTVRCSGATASPPFSTLRHRYLTRT